MGTIKDFRNMVICGNWVDVLRTIPSQSVHLICTSPPYWSQRLYWFGTDSPCDPKKGQHHDWTVLPNGYLQECKHCGAKAPTLGLEPSFEEWIENLVVGFREVRRVLRDDGVMLINCGDKYNQQPGNYRGISQGIKGEAGSTLEGGMKQLANKSYRYNDRAIDKNLASGNLIGLAWRLALALQKDGWVLRSDIVWAKGLSFCPTYSGSTMPESVSGTAWVRCRKRTWPNADIDTTPDLRRDRQQGRKFGIAEVQDCPGCAKCRDTGGYVLRRGSGRCTKAHEHIFQFCKKPGYFWDTEAIREPIAATTLERDKYTRILKNDGPQAVRHDHETPSNPSGRNIRDVWTISPTPYTGYSQTSRLVRVERDDVSDDTMHTVSPNCPRHGGLFDLLSKALDGEHADDLKSHILDRLDPAEEREGDFVPVETLRTYHFGRRNWDARIRDNVVPAIARSISSSKKDHVPSSVLACTPSAQRLAHIVHTLKLHGLSEQCANIYGNNTWPDEFETHLLDQMIYRTVDKSSSDILSDKCLCGLYHKTTQKSSHYATFSPKIPEICIKAATSEKGCCPKCGAPYARILDKPKVGAWHDHSEDLSAGARQSTGGPGRNGYRDSQTLGWRPTCQCNAGNPIPCVVLDPFLGSGTTCAVAARLGRDWIGVDINPTYLTEQATFRIAEGETGIPVADQRAGQMGLFQQE